MEEKKETAFDKLVKPDKVRYEPNKLTPAQRQKVDTIMNKIHAKEIKARQYKELRDKKKKAAKVARRKNRKK